MRVLYEFRNVSFVVSSKDGSAAPVSILSDVSFKVREGSCIVITGPSGSGKSTLLRLFNRLADPTSGVIFFEGKDLREHPVLELRSRIGWVPQVPVRFPGSVEANIRLPFALAKRREYSDEQIEARIRDLKSLGLLPEKLFGRDASDLSVGEAQRMNLLRALALKPCVLLLDEPTSALDPESAETLLDQVVRVRSEWGITTVMVSHRPGEASRLAGSTIRVEQGRVFPQDLLEGGT